MLVCVSSKLNIHTCINEGALLDVYLVGDIDIEVAAPTFSPPLGSFFFTFKAKVAN